MNRPTCHKCGVVFEFSHPIRMKVGALSYLVKDGHAGRTGHPHNLRMVGRFCDFAPCFLENDHENRRPILGSCGCTMCFICCVANDYYCPRCRRTTFTPTSPINNAILDRIERSQQPVGPVENAAVPDENPVNEEEINHAEDASSDEEPLRTNEEQIPPGTTETNQEPLPTPHPAPEASKNRPLLTINLSVSPTTTWFSLCVLLAALMIVFAVYFYRPKEDYNSVC